MRSVFVIFVGGLHEERPPVLKRRKYTMGLLKNEEGIRRKDVF